MRRSALFLFLAFAVFALSFVLAERRSKRPGKQGEAQQLGAFPLFSPAKFTLKNLPFTVVIVGFNNGATVEKTLGSVLAQVYENYRLIYIDDASDDGSSDLARECISQSDPVTRASFVQNEKRLGDLANLYRAVQTCQDDEVIVVLSGEDWLAHEWVLARLNAYYADPNLWISMAQSIDFPTYQLGSFQHLQSNTPRLDFSGCPQLKSFYAGLFKKIRKSDFVSGGDFLSASSELAYMTPMLEMGKEHLHLIPEVLSIHNCNAIHKEEREVQLRYEALIRSIEPYRSLTVLREIPWDD